MVDTFEMNKMEKIRYQQMTLSDTAADVFSSAVGQAQTRYVFAILISNDEGDSQQMTIAHRDTDDSDTNFIDSVRLDGGGTLLIGSYDWRCPILVMGSDEQLRANMDTAAKTGEITVWYWDEDLN